MKKKTKIIISLVLVAVILVCAVGERIYQPPSRTHDMSAAENGANLSAGSSDWEKERENIREQVGTDTEAMGIVNPNVTCFTEEDSEKICDAVETVRLLDNGYEIILQDEAEPYFENLGSGDIFFLDGDEDSPFGEPYFGKIVSADYGEEMVIYAENPAIDEVFDDFELELNEYLMEENIREIRAFEGVEVEVGASLDEVDLDVDYSDPDTFFVSSESYSMPVASSMGGRGGEEGDNENTFVSDEASFLIKLDFDLGKCINDVKGYEKIKADKEGETKLNIRGEIGLEKVQLRATADFSVSYENFVKELSAGARGDFVTNVSVSWKTEADFDKMEAKEARKIKFGNLVKISGLSNKLFPLVYIDILTGRTVQLVTSGGNDNSEYRLLTSIPVACGIMVYSDVNGNISFETGLSFKYEKEVDLGDFIFVRDGQPVMKAEKETENETKKAPECDFGFYLEGQGEVDVDFLGVSALVYILNINLVDIALVKVGTEAEGKIEFKAGTGGAETSVNGYLRVYLKVMDISMKLKASIKFLYFKISPEFALSYTLWDATLYELGDKNPTYFDDGNMGVRQLTAYDKQYVYYKDQNGDLVRGKRNGSGKETISQESFYMICGIDQSYVYQLRCTDKKGIYDLYRVAKDGEGSRMLVSGVAQFLYNGPESLFYVPEDNRKQIRILNRQSRNHYQFAEFSETVELMEYQPDKGVYLVTGGASSVARILGRGGSYYYVTENGEVTKIGTSLEIQDMGLHKEGKYTYRYVPSSSGYIRNASFSYYIVPENGEAIKPDYMTGWLPTKYGLFTTLRNDQEDSTRPYNIVRYTDQAEPEIITDVDSDHAFFTLVKDDRGFWYFFDQNNTELRLYRLDSDFTNKVLIKSFLRSEVNYNLTDCATSIIDNVIYFYSIPDADSSEMIYRYSIYQEATW